MGKIVNKAVKIGSFGLLDAQDEQGNYVTPEQKAAKAAQQYYGDYDKSMGDATKGVQEGAFTKDVFGEGGLQSQLAGENKDLASRGYSLQPQDHEAYGQASGDISRLFGQQEQQASQSLARRGLGGGSSGAAGAAFSGLAGNKNEMLAKAQTDIAQKRMADTTQRLQSTRNAMASLANQGTGMANSAFQQKGASLQQAAGNEAGMNEQNRNTLADQQAAVNPGLFSTVSQGLTRGIGQLAQSAPGMAAGGIGGGAAGAGAASAGGGGAASSAPGWGASSYGSSGFANKKGPSLFG